MSIKRPRRFHRFCSRSRTRKLSGPQPLEDRLLMAIDAGFVASQAYDGVLQFEAAQEELGSLIDPMASPNTPLTLGLPIVGSSWAEQVDLTAALAALDLPTLDPNVLSTEQIRAQLEQAGFTVAYIISDAELAAGPADGANLLTATRRYSLLDLAQGNEFSVAGELGIAGFASGIISGSLAGRLDMFLDLTLGVDTQGFYFGSDTDLTLEADLDGTLAAALPCLTAYAEGHLDLSARVTLGTADTSGDGRVHAAEFNAGLSQLPLSLEGEAGVAIHGTLASLGIEANGDFRWTIDGQGATLGEPTFTFSAGMAFGSVGLSQVTGSFDSDTLVIDSATIHLPGAVFGADAQGTLTTPLVIEGGILQSGQATFSDFDLPQAGSFQAHLDSAVLNFSLTDDFQLDDVLGTVSAFGVQVAFAGEVNSNGDFVATAEVAPFELGDVTVGLTGLVSRSQGELDFDLTANLAGALLPGLILKEQSSGLPSQVRLKRQSGLTLAARAEAFGVSLEIDGAIQSLDTFTVDVTAEPIDLLGLDVILNGDISREAGVLDWSLSGSIFNWEPAAAVSIDSLTVTLDSQGLALEALGTVAGQDVHLVGDYLFQSQTFLLMADVLSHDWTPIENVITLSDAVFIVGNRNTDGSQGSVWLRAEATTSLFGQEFAAVASISSRGTWVAAVPSGNWQPVPLVEIDDAMAIVSSYDFTLDTRDISEVTPAPAVLENYHRVIHSGINLLGTWNLPEAIPGIGGSEVQIAGVLGLSLADLEIQAKVVLDAPWSLGDVIEVDALALEISVVSGAPSLSLVGFGTVQGTIFGLENDFAIEAELQLTPTNLTGSLSLAPGVVLSNVFGIEGLNVLEADIQVGQSFVATPLPPPTLGFNFLVELPEYVYTALNLPATIGGSLNVSNTNPILALNVENWQPLAIVGIDNLVINEAQFSVAPNGGTIGTQTFDRGISAKFNANVFGASVNFAGAFDEQTQGILIEATVSTLDIAGVVITGAGPDGDFEAVADNGVYFRAALNASMPESNGLTFAGLIELPGDDAQGQPAIAMLSGEVDGQGLTLDGDIQNWKLLGGTIDINHASFHAVVPFVDPRLAVLELDADMDLLGSNIILAGTFSSDGIALAGTLAGNNLVFAGIGVEQFIFSFSTLPEDEHAFVSLTIDLPGAGGETQVTGSLTEESLSLAGTIENWEPLGVGVVEFNGSLEAYVDLNASELDFSFDVHAHVLGSQADFYGELTAGPGGYAIYAEGSVALQFANGTPLATLAATIDLGRYSAFTIGLAGDFRLPGVRPADAMLRGSIGTGGVELAASLDNWGLVPGVSFDGSLTVAANFQGTSVIVDMDLRTELLGTKLKMTGQVTAGSGGLDFHNLTGAISLGGSRLGFMQLDLTAHIDSYTDASGKHYSLGFDGDLTALGGKIEVGVSADLEAGPSGWRMDIRADFDLDLLHFSYSGFELDVDFNADLELAIGSQMSDFSFELNGSLQAKAVVPDLGSYTNNVGLGSISFNPSSGNLNIPNASIKINYWNGIPTGISWKDLNLDMGEPTPATTTVNASREGGVIQVRGGSSAERISVSHMHMEIMNYVVVRAANSDGDWVTVLSTPNLGITMIDVDAGGGNDEITIHSSLPTTLRGGAGADIIRGGSGPNIIYGGRGPATDDSPTGIKGYSGPFGFLMDTAPDGGDQLFGGVGNDQIYGEDGNDIIVGGGGSDVLDGEEGVNIVNGRLLVLGTGRNDHLQVSRIVGEESLVVRSINPTGAAVTLLKTALSNVSLMEVNAGAGDDWIEISSAITLATLLRGGAGSDLIQGGSGPNTICGGDDPDVIYGGAAIDQLFGEGGDDRIYGRGGNDTINGGADDEPEFFAAALPTMLEDAPAQTIAGWATINPALATASAATFVVLRVSNPSLFSILPYVAANGTLTYTLAPNAFGQSTFDVVLQHAGVDPGIEIDATRFQTFTINVLSVNDAPSFWALNPPTIYATSSTQTVRRWAMFNPGPADEAGQTATYTVTSVTNTGLFTQLPRVSPDGTLTYTPRSGYSGTATFSVRVTDNGGTANGGQNVSATRSFTITILPPTKTWQFQTVAGGALDSANTALEIAQLNPLVSAAIARWQASGLNAAGVQRLQDVKFEIVDLPDDRLGAAADNIVLIDENAAGYGWFLDATPLADEEFVLDRRGRLTALAGTAAAGRLDLLTVLSHELGHILGLDDLHLPSNARHLMASHLMAGQRRTMTSVEVDAVMADENGSLLPGLLGVVADDALAATSCLSGPALTDLEIPMPLTAKGPPGSVLPAAVWEEFDLLADRADALGEFVSKSRTPSSIAGLDDLLACGICEDLEKSMVQ